MASATAKSGTGSSSQAMAPPTITSATCQPGVLRPLGAGSSHSAAGIPIEMAMYPTRVSPELRACGAAIIAWSCSGALIGAPTLNRSRRSIADASEVAIARPT